MKNHQENTNALPALFRNANGVDTPVQNSLCRAAAGIIDPSSTTAEARTPQEKLRGAALAHATLNAQESPLAQRVVGHTHVSSPADYQIVANIGRMYRPEEEANVHPGECKGLRHSRTADLQLASTNQSNQADQLVLLLGKENAA